MQINITRQAGGSTIVNLIILVIAVYGIYVGIQYVPQWIEARSVQKVLDEVDRQQGTNPVNSVHEAKEKVVRMLQVNELNDVVGNFKVTRSRDDIVITFNYERQLNLVYETRPIQYNQSVRFHAGPM